MMVLIHEMKVPLQIITTKGYQFVVNNLILAQNTVKALVLVVGTSLQDT